MIYESHIYWSPVLRPIEEKLGNDCKLQCCFSPYCSIEGLKNIFESNKQCITDGAFVVTRWRIEDLAMRYSSVDIFPYLEEKGIPLYLSDSLHAKLYVFNDGTLLCGSANATGKGLGIVHNYNIETATFANISIEDEIQIAAIRNSCVRVTQAIYEETLDAIEVFDLKASQVQESPISYKKSPYLLSDLPLSESPEDFLDTYFYVKNGGKLDYAGIQKFAADLSMLNLSLHEETDSVEEVLKSNFKKKPFIGYIVEKIDELESLRFGAVANLIHHKCQDVPLPCRLEIKESVRRLYNWITFCYDDIWWHVPGRKSMVIYKECSH